MSRPKLIQAGIIAPRTPHCPQVWTPSVVLAKSRSKVDGPPCRSMDQARESLRAYMLTGTWPEPAPKPAVSVFLSPEPVAPLALAAPEFRPYETTLKVRALQIGEDLEATAAVIREAGPVTVAVVGQVIEIVAAGEEAVYVTAGEWLVLSGRGKLRFAPFEPDDFERSFRAC